MKAFYSLGYSEGAMILTLKKTKLIGYQEVDGQDSTFQYHIKEARYRGLSGLANGHDWLYDNSDYK